MSNIITIGYVTEGPTDQRFLETVIKKTFDDTALLCNGLIEVYDPIPIHPLRSNGFIESIKDSAVKASRGGINVLCIHVDADGRSDSDVRSRKIDPAFSEVSSFVGDICKNLVSIVPVHMSEAWMLADKLLLKTEIGTTKTDEELNINRHPESFADPKAAIEEAIRIAQQHIQNRRRKLHIGELYQSIGQKISLQSLNQLESFKKFQSSVEIAFRVLNYLH